VRHSERGRVIAERYELEKALGQGGMGEVWSATDRQTGARVAVKLLHAGAADSKENRGRFEREARIAGTLVSPHICRVSDSGVSEEGDPFMVLELLEGEDLSKRIKTQGHLPASQVVTIAIQVGRALHVAHSAGLVHRDLKPGNIFLAQQGGEEVCKVLDFGIAKTGSMESTQYTSAGAMLGTSSYMSPEQVRSAKTVDHRADLWAFAVVLFRALTGELPFPQTGFELFLAMAEDPIPTPAKVTTLMPELPGPLNVFFERAFANKIDERYQSASAMVVGFCRAAGVTVPADVLYAADARTPSGQYQAAPPSSGQPAPGSGGHGAPVSGQASPGSGGYGAPASGPASPASGGHAPVSGPASPALGGYGGPPSSGQGGPASSPLGGTMMLDGDMALDPDEPDNAATLFYHPGHSPLSAASPGPPPPPPPNPGSTAGNHGPPSKPIVFTMPLDQARAAAGQLTSTGEHAAAAASAQQASGGQPSFVSQTGGWQNVAAQMQAGAPPAAPKPVRMWLWVAIGIVLVLAAGGGVSLLVQP
jgi:serine/threonine protein kinase